MSSPVPAAANRPPLASPGAIRLASAVLFGVLPALTVCLLFVGAIAADDVATDFRQFYGAASAILRGESPYLDSVDSMTVWGGPYPYPPLPALSAMPLPSPHDRISSATSVHCARLVS